MFYDLAEIKHILSLVLEDLGQNVKDTVQFFVTQSIIDLSLKVQNAKNSVMINVFMNENIN